MFENPKRGRQAVKFCNKCSNNSSSQIVFRTDIFQKLTLGAPVIGVVDLSYYKWLYERTSLSLLLNGVISFGSVFSNLRNDPYKLKTNHLNNRCNFNLIFSIRDKRNLSIDRCFCRIDVSNICRSIYDLRQCERLPLICRTSTTKGVFQAMKYNKVLKVTVL